MTTAAELLANDDLQQGFASVLAGYDAHRAELIRTEREALATLVQKEAERRSRKRL
ncbi:TPA: hypothetical protein QDB15_000039 [Burkholderia vietnamiensis]|uniref:Uncharacterized protein n=1 Tax=Pandoraea apista TaxID=93218 RepID=A0A5E5P1U0_9BURK|nr:MULTISPECIES: hypothetical protein [Burkholderiaceae]MCA8206313.1 hypothetical protein [Burkholderia vietnamiensis]VVG70417.1 hypothetical protein PAP18089_01377 [Pandoraea apista]HDR8943111.1 hypothetical protein [Burkholderia vietnamiensis]HDR9116315.1 hypothetical protein [Burkholderia vietnamiensis]HDR9205361.1 hypothetical protein [Burkholderia vietnamiensis]